MNRTTHDAARQAQPHELCKAPPIIKRIDAPGELVALFEVEDGCALRLGAITRHDGRVTLHCIDPMSDRAQLRVMRAWIEHLWAGGAI